MNESRLQKELTDLLVSDIVNPNGQREILLTAT